MSRWQATIHYRVERGVVDVTHELAEIADLHNLVEDGPHWDTVEQIVIVRINHCTSASLTVEEAERL